MSTLSQFFGSGGGGSSSTFKVRVQIQEGGGGATCVCQNHPGGAVCTTISGRGGNHADLNLTIEPGATCPITVGYGATSYHVPFCNYYSQSDPSGSCNFCPPPCGYYPTVVQGKRGEHGGPSAFGSGSNCLGFIPGGVCAGVRNPCSTCPAPPTAPSPGFISITDVPFVPKFDLSNLGSANRATEQNVGCQMGDVILSSYDGTEGQRAWDSTRDEYIGFLLPTGGTESCMYYCMIAPSNQSCPQGCHMAYSGGADTPAQVSRWLGKEVITCDGRPCLSSDNYGSDGTNGTNKNNQFQLYYACCGGVVSTITGAVCAYGVGGHIRQTFRPTQPTPRNKASEHCYDPHARFRFDGSGAGGNTIYACSNCFPTTETISHGCPGSVIIQYPDEFAAATTSSPSVVDCSPNTPGSRTYKFLCPGTITFP